MLKSRKITYILLLTILFSVALPSLVVATSVDDIKKEEAKVKSESATLNDEINTVVDSINEKYQELAKLDQDITKSQKEIEQTEKEIVQTQESIIKRSEVVAERMKDMQLRGVGQNSFQALLDAENFSDFINRAYAVSVLQNAEKSKIDSLYNDKERLDELETKLVETQSTLEEKLDTVKTEKVSLDTQVEGLQGKIAANASTLNSLTADRIEKENALRVAEAAKIEAETKAKKETELINKTPTKTTNSSNNTTDSTTDNGHVGGGIITPPAPTPPTPTPNPPVAGGIQGQATAYVATGNNTATGTVPTVGRTIAVDRNLIPLGSAVRIEVPSAPQYSGVYYAEDTGGAVNGYIVDIFVGSQSEALNFGRRGIIITVL